MSDGVMEALSSGTSSESESDTPESPLKDLRSPKHSPTKKKFISRAVEVSPDSDATVCLNDDKVLKGNSTVTLDFDENLISNITKQRSKQTALLLMDDSNSSDVPLIKFVGSRKKNENKEDKAKAIVTSSSSTKKRMKVLSESDSSSNDSETTALLHDTSTGSNSTDMQVCEIPIMSNTKKALKMAENTKKTNLKRKRCFESSDNEEKINSESKKKLKISSVSHSDGIDKGKCVTPVPASGKKKTSLTISAVKKVKSDSVTVKKILVSASSKKNSSVQNQSITGSPLKSESSVSSDSDSDGNVSKKSVTPPAPASGKKKISLSAVKKRKEESVTSPISKLSHLTKKLDTSDIMDRLDDSSNGTNDLSSSEDIEMKEPQKSDKKSDAKSSSDSDEESDTLKKNDKILQQKKTSSSSINSSSDSNSSYSDSNDDLKEKNTTKNRIGKSGPAAKRSKTKASSSSSSEQESEHISPKKKKTAPKGEKIDKKGSKKNDKNTPGAGRIVRLQRYLKEAGIRVKNYETLWQGCKSDKARAEKLLELLHARGLKGKPSISECRKLKKKFETQKEISELNTSNIIAANGRSRRGATNTFGSRRSSSPQSTKKQETSPKSSPKFKKMFSRLRNIVDSENDSD